MTTERRKAYLASISKEERILREKIEETKFKLLSAKDNLTIYRKNLHELWFKSDVVTYNHLELKCRERIGYYYQKVRKEKIILKALRKQLPMMPCKGCNRYYGSCMAVDEMEDDLNYCPHTGQKLKR